MAVAVAPDRARPLLWLAALALVYSTAGDPQAADVTPAYVARGRETEARQHAYHDRIERFYQALSEHLRDAAPDLLATLAAPPADVHGYQILPRVVADPAPPAPGTTAGIVSFSWRWSDTLIEREMAGLERLETGLAQVPPDARRPRDREARRRLPRGHRPSPADRRQHPVQLALAGAYRPRPAALRPSEDGPGRRARATGDRSGDRVA